MKAQEDVFAYLICNDLDKLEDLEKICKQIKGDELDIFRVAIHYIKFLYNSNRDPLKITVALAFLTKMKDEYYDKITAPLLNKGRVIQCALYISRYIRYKDPYYLDKAISMLDHMYASEMENIIKFLAIELKRDKWFRIKLMEIITTYLQEYGVRSLRYDLPELILILLARMGFYKDLDKILDEVNYFVLRNDKGTSTILKEILEKLDYIKDSLGVSIINKIYKEGVINLARRRSDISDTLKNIIIGQSIKYGDFIDFDVLEQNWHDYEDKSTLILALSNIIYRLRQLDASKGIVLRGEYYSKERFEFLLNNRCERLYQLISNQPMLDDNIILAIGKTGSKECINKLNELIDSSDNSININILDAVIHSMDEGLINKTIQKFIKRRSVKLFNYKYPDFVAKLISEDNLIEMIKAFDRFTYKKPDYKKRDNIEALLLNYAKLKKRWDIIEKILDSRLNEDKFDDCLRIAIDISPDKAAEYLIRNRGKIKSINHNILMLCVYTMIEKNNQTVEHLLKHMVVEYNLSNKIKHIVLSSGSPSAFKFLYQNAHILAKGFKIEDKEILKFIPEENIIQPALDTIRNTSQDEHLQEIMNILKELDQGDIIHKMIKTVTTNSPDHSSRSELIISLSKLIPTINEEIFLSA
ncbi:MAG: hypothetical protein NZM04_08030 [Methylacidiphilales bacterium]|nr:hypothetical protein [Candidatus Methylacidiphilales bacterium]